MTKDKSPIGDRLGILVGFFWTMLKELAAGFRFDRIPAHRWCYPGICLAIALIFRFDESVLFRLHRAPRLHGYSRFAMEIAFACSGWILWSFSRAAKRYELLSKLRDALDSCNWKCMGRYPSLIEDVEVDEHVRKLRLKTAGVTLTEFQNGREKFEHMMNVSIVRLMTDPKDKQRLDLYYAAQDLPREALLERAETYTDADLPIGLSHEGPLRINFRDVPHILVAGQSGGGKSNFMKLAATTLSLNNPNASVLFLDCKGGMECADLKGQLENMRSNFKFCEGSRACAEELKNLGVELENRLRFFAQRNFSSFDSYMKARVRKRVAQDGRADVLQRRTFILIDEIAQIYLKDPTLNKELAMSAREAVNRIARQGRAAGFHLVAATQKPDAASFDQTVKANMPGVLCFPMANQPASVGAVGTKRAYELDPDIKGRAVWKFGPKMEEVQTFLFATANSEDENPASVRPPERNEKETDGETNVD